MQGCGVLNCIQIPDPLLEGRWAEPAHAPAAPRPRFPLSRKGVPTHLQAGPAYLGQGLGAHGGAFPFLQLNFENAHEGPGTP